MLYPKLWKPVVALIPPSKPSCPLVLQDITPLLLFFNSRASVSVSSVSVILKALNNLNRGVLCSGRFNNLDSRFNRSVINPSVVTETTLPPKDFMLCKHSPTTLLIKAVVQEAKIGLDNSVPDILTILIVLVSKDFLLEIPLTTLP